MKNTPLKHVFAHLFCFIFLAVFFPQNAALAQNLIDNPGFENGITNWDTWWTSDPDAGTAAVVDSAAYSGTHSMRVEHWGEFYFSLQADQQFSVQSGALYEFSAYIRCEYAGDYAQMALSMFDDSLNAIYWSFAPVQIEPTNGDFVLLTSRFLIPADVTIMSVGFGGGDSILCFIDDVSLVKIADPTPQSVYTLENENFKVDISFPFFRADVTDKTSGRIFVVKESYEFSAASVSQNQNTLTVQTQFTETNAPVEVTISLSQNGLRWVIAADPNTPLTSDILFPGQIDSRPGEFFIIPRAEGLIIPVETDYPYWRYMPYKYKGTSGYCGVTDFQTGYLLTVEQPYDAEIHFVREGETGPLSLNLHMLPSKGALGYDRAIDITFASSGGYVTLAKQYRQIAETLGFVRTFAEKQLDNPNIEKLAGCVDFYLLHPEFYEPAFIDSLYKYGMRQALISVSGGWITTGMSELVDSINAHGFLSGRYDNFLDVWPPTHPEHPWFRTEGYPEDVVVLEDGSLYEGYLVIFDDGTPFQGYETCAATHEDWARPRITQDLDSTHYAFRFIDGQMSSELVNCYSTVHPTSRLQDASSRTGTFEMLKDEFGLIVGTEESRDFSFFYCDYGEGTMSMEHPTGSGEDWMTPIDEPNPNYALISMNAAVRIPLRSLAFHDVHVPTWYTGDGISKVPDYWETKDCFNALYATMSLAIPPSAGYWTAYKERYLTSFFLTGAVHRNAGFEPMLSHRFLSEDRLLQETVFENGWTVYANFGTTPAAFGNYQLGKDCFYASDGTFEVARSEQNGAVVSAAYTEDLLFVNPGGAGEISYKGLVTNGTLAFRKEGNTLPFSFIGNHTSFDINTDELPWQVGNFEVVTPEGYHATVEDLGNNVFRIHKFGDEIFYTIISDSVITDATGSEPDLQYTLEQNYPNPFNASTVIRFSLKDDTFASLQLFDALGRLVQTVFSETRKRGTYEARIDLTGLASGVYFYRLDAGTFRDVKKLIIVK